MTDSRWIPGTSSPEHGISANDNCPARLTRQESTELDAVRITVGLDGPVCPSDLSNELIARVSVVGTGLGQRGVEAGLDDDHDAVFYQLQ